MPSTFLVSICGRCGCAGGVGCCACAAGMVKAVINAAAIPARYTRDMVFTPWFSGDGAGLPQRVPRPIIVLGPMIPTRFFDSRMREIWADPRVDAKEDSGAGCCGAYVNDCAMEGWYHPSIA